MRNYHAKSYSEQARRLGNNLYNTYIEGTPLEMCEDAIIYSYRHPLVKQRVAKRFGKLLRRNKK